MTWRSALYILGCMLAIAIFAGGSGITINQLVVAEEAPRWFGFVVGLALSGFAGYGMGRVAGYGWELTEDWRNVQ